MGKRVSNVEARGSDPPTITTKKGIGAVLLVAIGAAAIALCWPKAAIENRDVGSVATGLDEQHKEFFVGTWQDDFKGRRVLTVRADGTATMVVEPDGLNALFASRLTFEEEWRIEGGELWMKAIGGEPKTRVSFILQTMGNETVQKILELTNDRMLLLDADGKTEYDWRRVD